MYVRRCISTGKLIPHYVISARSAKFKSRLPARLDRFWRLVLVRGVFSFTYLRLAIENSASKMKPECTTPSFRWQDEGRWKRRPLEQERVSRSDRVEREDDFWISPSERWWRNEGLACRWNCTYAHTFHILFGQFSIEEEVVFYVLPTLWAIPSSIPFQVSWGSSRGEFISRKALLIR